MQAAAILTGLRPPNALKEKGEPLPPARQGNLMFNSTSNQQRYCDGLNRRSFLQIGALAMGGLSLPSLLQAEQRAGRSSGKSVIMVYLSGGLSHHDSFDLKPDAPA